MSTQEEAVDLSFFQHDDDDGEEEEEELVRAAAESLAPTQVIVPPLNSGGEYGVADSVHQCGTVQCDHL